MAGTKEKKPKKEKEDKLIPIVKLGDFSVESIELKDIYANSAQTRGMGVCPTLLELGYPLFGKPKEKGKDSLWSMLTGEDEGIRAEALSLLEEHEKGIIVLCNKIIQGGGLLQPIGVIKDKGGKYDVIWGMRRALACAANYARNSELYPSDIEAKVFESGMTLLERQFLALTENDEREEESIMDLAISYERILKSDKGISPKSLGLRIGRSDQHIRDYLKMLHPKLKDKRHEIHTGKMGIEPAKRLLEARIAHGDKAELPDRKPRPDNTRSRMPSTRMIDKWLDAVHRPKTVSAEEWALFTSDDVRKWCCMRTDRNFVAYTGSQDEKPKKEKEEETEKVVVKKEAVLRLLLVLGNADCRTWADDILEEKLEEAVTEAEEDVELEGEKEKKLFAKLREAYEDGTRVDIDLKTKEPKPGKNGKAKKEKAKEVEEVEDEPEGGEESE